MSEINWYPGHMAKTRRELEKQLKAVDAVIELCDARAPYATRNPDLKRMAGNKQHILILNKSDLADESVTGSWVRHYKSQGLTAIPFRSTGGKAKDIFRLIEDACAERVERMKARGVNKTVRVMVVGIPNVGKSTFINRLKGQAVAKAADRPGVTRSNQWVKINPYLELLDTPGMLWPKLDDEQAALRLAFLGSIPDDIMDNESLAAELVSQLLVIQPEAVLSRWKLDESVKTCPKDALLEACCRGRGLLLSGGRYDTLRCAHLVLDEFRGGKMGRITLERIGAEA
ncbi:MAG: ribosome biogenesis GTPase YlqF [Clostridia bacterium]|nr:ribosome biogenesis GTPase YlqF [Clostridia bacterium]